MKCPGCGAMATVAMLEKGECSYCHAALEHPRHEPEPKVVHVTNVEIRGPDVSEIGEVAGSVVGSVTTRLAGCFTGCLTTAFTMALISAVTGFVLWQVWMENRHLTSPVPDPPSAPEAPRRTGHRR